MAVEMCAGVWRTRSGDLVNVQWRTPGGFWVCADGSTRRDNGTYRRGEQNDQDLVAFVSFPELPEQPQPQPDAAEELAAVRHEAEPHPGGIMAEGVAVRLSAGNFSAEYRESIESLTDDRDRWQARAKQAEGQANNLAQELVRVRGEARQSLEALNDMRAQLATAQEAVTRQRQGWDDLQQQLSNRVRQVNDLQAQLEAAVHVPDLSADLERVAAERDAAREEVRGLQVRTQQAEGDARQVAAKMRHFEGEASKWKAQVIVKNDTLLRAEAANDALRSLILDLFERVSNDD